MGLLMADIIRPRMFEETTHHSVFYCRHGHTGWGWEFDTDADYAVDESKLAPVALAAYRACQSGIVDGIPVKAPEFKRWTQRVIHPAIVRCGCGAEHELIDSNGMGDSQCPRCGQWRNSCGQCLTNPDSWGEETGETFDSSGHFVHNDFHDYGPEGA